ncbi:MAG TPA: amidohydrolase family protein [Solirubrobacterales bacterium]|nr:amidohydrolase family protein [Solirubrobacterales bacterium]
MRLGVSAALVDGELLPGDVEIVDGRIATVGLAGSGGNGLAVPGFVDLQVNGYAGVDFSAASEDEWRSAREALLRDGVTAFQPTFVTAELSEMRESLARMPAVDPGGNASISDSGCATAGPPLGSGPGARDTGDDPDRRATGAEVAQGSRVIGAHLEGPFLSPLRPGAHDPSALLAPDLDALDALLADGTVSQVALAPELSGALELIDVLVERGVTVSCGHTEADAAAARVAFDRGATAVTHLFNAMRRPEARDPGIAYVALGRAGVFITLIVDGHHLADDTVRMAWRAAGERVVLISDAVAAAAAPDGDYTLGGAVPIHSAEGVVRNDAGSLAGSTLSMLAAVRNSLALGVPLAAALAAATEAPARMARRPDLGRITPGARADLLVLTDTLEIERVLLEGVTQPC